MCLCKIEGNEGQNCNAIISRFFGCKKNAPTRISNIKRHLQRHHANIYVKIIILCVMLQSERLEDVMTIVERNAWHAFRMVVQGFLVAKKP